MKTFRFIFVCIFMLLFACPSSCMARSEAVLGKIKITNYKKNVEKSSEVVDYIIYGNKSRVQASEKVYYLIDLKTEKTRVVNNKRERVTITYASSILEHSLPPLVILKNRASLKNYLTSINATLESVIQIGLRNYELWQFNIGNAFYKVKVKLPEYYPEEIEISSKKRKTIIEVIDKQEIPAAELNKSLLQAPENYKIVDLIKK